MYSIKMKVSPGLAELLKSHPNLYAKAQQRGDQRTLIMLAKTARKKAPYDRGHLRREIKPIFASRKVVAGTHISKKYAHVQEDGMIIKARNKPFLVFKTKDGAWHSVKQVKIPAKKYFYSTVEERSREAVDIYAKEFNRALGGY